MKKMRLAFIHNGISYSGEKQEYTQDEYKRLVDYAHSLISAENEENFYAVKVETYRGTKVTENYILTPNILRNCIANVIIIERVPS